MQADVKGKRVLVRVDFNAEGDDGKIIAALPTIRHLLANNCRIILISHLGRPRGKVMEGLRLDGVARRLSGLLGLDVRKLDENSGASVKEAVEEMKAGDVLLLENIQFNPGECNKDENFAKELASLADVFVLDAFGQSHRDYASLAMIQRFLPSCAGLLLEKEVRILSSLLESPERPFIAVLGGAKVSDKIRLVDRLLKKVDGLVIGGAMAFTFLKAKGLSVGNSKVEDGYVSEAARLIESGKIVLPVDVVAADKFDSGAKARTVAVGSIPAGWMGLDIGPDSVKLFEKELERAKTVVWNGPMGVFEFDEFAEGTLQLARFISKSGATTIIGGGDTIAAAGKAGVRGKFTHTSTGGGAMLEFLEGKKLPAIEALEMSETATRSLPASARSKEGGF